MSSANRHYSNRLKGNLMSNRKSVERIELERERRASERERATARRMARKAKVVARVSFGGAR